MRRLTALFALAVVVAWIVAGCSGAREAGGDGASFPGDYRRVVTPSVPVLDSTGARYAHPFYGGLNVPRPEFVDVDGDGDADLFLQEKSGELAFFENVEAGGEGSDSTRLAWRTDHFQDIQLGEWFRFADLDQDGDPDLLVERPYSYIRVYRNTGSAGDPHFELFADTLRTPSGKPIFSDRQNIPNVTDVDCNGRLDLFLGKLDGTVSRYEAKGDTAGIPHFELVNDTFEGIEIVNQQMASTRHGANTLAFADVDGDGDEDLLWGDFFEPGLLLIENTGRSCEDPNFRTSPQPFPPSDPVKTSGYNAPTLADWNGDGTLDLFVGVLGGAFDANTTLAQNFLYYERASGSFRKRTEQFLGAVDVGSESATAWADVDGDGDLDGLIANKIDPAQGQTSRVYVLENTGSSGAPSYRMRSPLALPNAYHYSPALGDLTGDGTPDLVLGTWKGRLLFAPGTGDGTFGSVTQLAELPRGSNAVPALGDVDGDGDLDLVVGESAGTLNLYRNTGGADDGSVPSFTLETESFAGVDVDDRAAPALQDVDGDGDLDVVVGTQAKGLRLARNTGTPQSPEFAETDSLALPAPRLAVPAFADLDADGTPDLLLGTEGGGVQLFLGE
jgi:hypothetical protein